MNPVLQDRTEDDMNATTAPFQVTPPEPGESLRLKHFMQTSVIRAAMDSTLGEAMTLCFQHRIRHLPVINDEGKLVGLLTDRDLRFYISHRLGTIMENNSDREALHHHLHVIMVRRVVSGRPEMTLTQGARLMLENRIGCLPVIDGENRLIGIVTTGDFLRLIAEENISAIGPLAVPVQARQVMP
jgi:CBS domain-containing protein